MDIAQTTQPKSDQQNYDDYGPTNTRVLTVTEVKAGSSEQPVEIHVAEFPGRPYKPSKSMRRVLGECWGRETSEYVGRRMKLAGDPTVKFGGVTVGGIKIAALSHIDKTMNISLTVTRGKRAPHKVEPLVEDAPPAQPTTEDIATSTDLDKLSAMWKASPPNGQQRSQIEARVAAIKTEATS